MSAVTSFNISAWNAWAPGLADADDWHRWAQRPFAPTEDAQPDVSFLPALQRRRLSRLARMAFYVAWPLAEAYQAPQPLVFVSRHGETPRTFALLSELAERQPLSPTNFSLSVHNAIIGQWSIMRGDHSEMTALAGDADGFEHAVMEASLLLAEGAPSVLVVIAEELPPPAYEGWINDVPFPYAVALRLTRGDEWQLSQQPATSQISVSEWPHALSLVQQLINEQPSRSQSCGPRLWTWQYNA